MVNLEVQFKLEYLKMLQSFLANESLSAEGKESFLQRAERVCRSVEEDLKIK